MTTKHHMVGLFCGLTLLALVVGCQGGSSTKNLTEQSAKRMLVAKISAENKDNYLLNFDAVSEISREPTREDYAEGTYRINDPILAVGRLIKAGYIVQSRKDFTVPNVSGNYRVELKWPKEVSSIALRNAIYTFSLSMEPTFSTVSGKYSLDSWVNSGQETMSANGPLIGSVSEDGTVQLAYVTQYGSRIEEAYKFSTSGQGMSLTGNQPFLNGIPTMTLTGSGPRGTISVPSFSYAFSDKFKPLASPNSNEIVAGKIVVDEVNNLLLATDTVAQARFTWHVIFNDAGRALSGEPRVSGTGNMIFGKQPDGNWVLSEYEF
ncbi:MAG: hypothetical protein ACYCZM_11720 [Acidimicrobiales bacterium]